jgi:hypothetical protein
LKYYAKHNKLIFINDTIINSKTFVKIEVDSLSKYPLEKEMLAEYKQRLKKVMNSNNSSSTNWKKVRIILLSIVGLFVSIVIYSLITFDISGSSLPFPY